MEKNKLKAYDEYENLTFHPYNILLFLVLFGITALFLAMSAAFIYTRVQADLPPIQLPALFVFNTIILMGSSATLWWAKKAFQKDDTNTYQKALLLTILLTLLFLVLQIIAWSLLFSNQYYLGKDNSISYLYVISGLHFVHVIAGLPFLFLFLRTAKIHMKEPVSVLVYFTDPAKRLKLRLLSIYWHFLDILWIYLVLFFWINHLLG